MSPQAVHYVPIVTTILAVFFSAEIFRRYREHPERLHLWWWAFGIAVYGVGTLTGAAALTRGTVTDGTNPLDNSSLAGTPFDNITPSKVIANARFTESRGWWWVEYGVRAQGEVTRIAETLLDSPFLIAQDLLSLDGFAIHRLGWGINLTRGRDRVGVTFAVENLADKYYREHFQFAPARGRSFTVGVTVGAF